MSADREKSRAGPQEPGRPFRESGEVFRMMVEHANEAILVAQDGMLRFVNPKMTDLIGYAAREMTQKPFDQFLHPEDRPLVSERHRRRLRGEDFAHVYPCRVMHRDGRVIWVEINAVLFAWEGKPATLIFLNDITSRRRAEEALRESEEKYRQLFLTESDAILLFYADTGEIIDVNDAALELYGYPRDAFLALRIQDVSAEPEATLISVAKTVTGNFSRIPLRYHRKKDGTRFPVEISSSTFLLGDRKVLCGAIRDISERLRMQEALREHQEDLERLVRERTAELETSNQRLRREVEERSRVESSLRRREEQFSTLVENSLTGIYLDQDETIVFANQRFADIYGYTREEIIGLPTMDLVHPEDRPRLREIRALRLRGEEAPSAYEARGLSRSGRVLWIKRRNTLIEYKGRPAILGNIVDISERKQAEEDLRRTNEELKSFVHVVTHDLKNPIISIQGFSARLLKKYREVLEEKGAGYIHQIRASARRMELLVTDLLTLSMAGRLAPSLSEVSMEAVVREVAGGLQHLFLESGVQWVLEGPLPTVRCDRERIYQVLENLLTNAVKFRADCGQPEVRIGCRVTDPAFIFSVCDNGIGLDPKHKEKIFERFFRVQQVRDEGGTGLGLSIVQKIVESHGGRVWVESEPGRGSCFRFSLPKDGTA